MSSTSPSLCQQVQCDAFQFTICRHCQLFLCIRHLAEHQQQFPSDFQRLLDDARRQQAQLSTFDTRSTDLRTKTNSNLENETQTYRPLTNFVPTNKTTTNLPSTDKFLDMRFNGMRLPPTSVFMSTMEKLAPLIGNETESTTMNINPSQYIDPTLYASFPASSVKPEQNSSNSYSTTHQSLLNMIKTSEDDEELHETDTPQTQNSLTVRELKTYKCDYCPLSTNTYGIEAHHQVRHIPCVRRSTSQVSLFEHLKQYHYLNYAASMQIVRLVASGDLDDHPTLFSSADQSSIVSILPSFFRAPCPLTQHNVFGLGPMHGIRLCSPSTEQQDFALYDHFLAFHQLNRASAMKLVKAMMKNENSSQRILFRPDEQVLNETAYVSCPLSNYDALLPHQERIPHTPCQSTVKLRYLTGHLRDVHHLNKVAAKRIASALRHEQGTHNGRFTGLFERDENILKAKKKKNSNRLRTTNQLNKHVQQVQHAFPSLPTHPIHHPIQTHLPLPPPPPPPPHRPHPNQPGQSSSAIW